MLLWSQTLVVNCSYHSTRVELYRHQILFWSKLPIHVTGICHVASARWHPPPSKIVSISQFSGEKLSALHWRHNEHDSVSNHQPHDYLLNRLFRRRSKKISKPRVTGLCAGNSPETGEFPEQMACDAENVSIWWRHHGILPLWSASSCGWHVILPCCSQSIYDGWVKD